MRAVVVSLLLLVLWHGMEAGQGSAAAPEGAQTPQDLLHRGRQVYEVHCAICHGVNGQGNGMAAHMFRVQPRDFRRGLFKFRSTPSGSLPTDEDLLQTLRQGIRWTGMIGRSDLSGEDLRGAIQHLKGFSPRFADERPASPVVVPPPPPKGQDLVAQGRQLYQDAECSKCHGDQGRGDGPSASGMRDDWGWPTRPSDLTWRPLKRGSTLEGIYLSIATGLSGTPMPSYGDSLDSNEIWALVYYLESLVPTERRMSPLRYLGEEPAGWMVLRMHGPPMRGGPMGPGHPMGASPMGQEMPRRMP